MRLVERRTLFHEVHQLECHGMINSDVVDIFGNPVKSFLENFAGAKVPACAGNTGKKPNYQLSIRSLRFDDFSYQLLNEEVMKPWGKQREIMLCRRQIPSDKQLVHAPFNILLSISRTPLNGLRFAYPSGISIGIK